MEAVATAEKLESWTAACAAYIEEGNIEIRPDGLRGAAADPSMVGMVDYRLKESFFQEYSVGDDEPDRVGVNYETLRQLVKKLPSDAAVTIEISAETITVETETSSAQLRALEIEDDDPDTEALEHSVEISPAVDAVAGALSRCGLFGNGTELTIEGELASLETDGDMGETCQEIVLDGAVPPEDAATVQLSLDYLNRALKGLDKLADQITVAAADDHPVKLEHKGDELRLAYIIAPRIQED